MRGLMSSLDPEMVPPDGCVEVENWIPRDGEFTTRPGLVVTGQDVNQRPAGFHQYDHDDGAIRTVMGTDDSWWRFDLGTGLWVDLSAALTATVEQIVFRSFPKSGVTWLLGCNGKDVPKKWDGTSASVADIGGSPPISRCMMKLFDRIILGNLKSGANAHPAAVDVSANKDFDTGYGTIQFGPLQDCDGEIVVMEDFGANVGAIYASDGVHIAIAEGGSTPFRFELKQRLARDQGPAATLALTKTGGGLHVWLAKDATMKSFNLNSVGDWGSADLASYLKRTINLTSIGRSWLDYDSVNQEVLIVFPEKGNSEPSAAVIVKERGGAFWPVRWAEKNLTAGRFVKIDRALRLSDLTVPLSTITQPLNELTAVTRHFLFGEKGGQVYEGDGEADQGQPIAAFVETGLSDLGEPTRNKTISSIQHRFQKIPWIQQVSIRIGRSRSGEIRELSNPKIINIGLPGPYSTGHRVSSKYVSMRMELQATGKVVWRGSFVESHPRGFRA
jgi:hypothetical protein